MPDKKLTDAEIVKALEEHYKQVDKGYSTHLEYGGKCDEHEEKYIYMLRDVLDLINRLQAENEELTAAKKTYESIIKKSFLEKAGFDIDPLAEIKAEAYKEFAKELEDICHFAVCNARGKCKLVERKNLKWYVDNILLKLAGDKNAG